jgi:VanZ family protein
VNGVKTGTVLLILWTVVLLALTLSPFAVSLLPQWGGFQHWDKVVHFCLFAVTGFISVYGAAFLARSWARALFGLVFGLVLALGTELGQTLVPGREMSRYDLYADLAGLIAGLVFYALLYSNHWLRARLKL